MGKTLVLAEKPSVGKEIARVLGCHGGGSGYMAGAQYVVTWALGHLVELAEPEHYGSQYKTWSLDSLPMMPEKMALKVIPETAKQFGVVKTWLHSKEIDSLVIATDAGREGELVARLILKKAGARKPLKRLWISSRISLSKTLPGFQFSSVSFFISRSACSITSLSVSSHAVTRVTLNSAGSLYRGFAVFIKMPYS